MVTVDQVTEYVDENVLHSKIYDSATPIQRKKAVNNAVNTLLRYLPDVYSSAEVIPVEDIVEQTIWLFKLDDTFQRAEMGATMITVDGIQMQISDRNRSIAPAVLHTHGRTSSRKARVGSYGVPLQDTFRMGLR